MRRGPIGNDSLPPGSGGGDRWIIGEMTEADLGAVLEIESRCFPSPWSRSAFVGEMRSAHGRCLVARERPAGRPLGYIMTWILQDELLINNFAVDPDHRKKGFGMLLLDATLSQARRSGCRTAYLEVRPSNEAAINLYRKNGFEVIGKRRGYYSDTREDALVMRARLGRPLP